MATFSRYLTNTYVVAALLTDYLVLFDFWIITPPASPTGPPTPERKRWIAGLKTTVCYAITQPLWAWAVAVSSADGMFWILMASYAAIVSVLGALDILSNGLHAIVKEHTEHCLDLETKESGSDPELNRATGLGNSEKAIQAEPPKMQPPPCTRHALPSTYYLAILLPTLTAAAADSALLFFARFLTSKDSMDWIQGSTAGWNILTSVAAFSYLGSKIMNWMVASLCNRGHSLATTRSWKAWLTLVGEKAVLLFILFVLRGTLRSLLGQTTLLRFSWKADSATLQLVGPLLDHEKWLQPEATKKMLGVNWYALPPWTTWLATGTTAVGQVWWMVSGRMRRNKKTKEEHFSVVDG